MLASPVVLGEGKQQYAASLHPTQQDLPASMAQPTPGSTKGQSSNSRKSASSFNATRNTTNNRKSTPSFNATRNSTNSRKSAPSFNTPGTNTVLFSRKGAETTRARVIPVNQSRPMSTKKQPKSKSIRKKKKKEENPCMMSSSSST